MLYVYAGYFNMLTSNRHNIWYMTPLNASYGYVHCITIHSVNNKWGSHAEHIHHLWEQGFCLPITKAFLKRGTCRLSVPSGGMPHI